MGYEFVQEETIAYGFRRILHEELSAAIESLENPGEAKEEAVHAVRKRIKKIRALFRLVRSELEEEIFRRENTRYRDIGHRLSHLRDATVMIKTLDKLQGAHPDQFPAKVYATLKQALEERQAQVSNAFFGDKNKMQEVNQAFQEARQQIPGLSGSNNSFAVFAPNLKGIYKRGIRAFKVTAREPSIHNFHELRKEVKNIWYHTRLFQPVWPGLFEAYAKEYGAVGEMLGEDHDYGVLAEEIESDRLPVENGEEKTILLALLHQQREKLQQQFVPLARRLFAEQPADFAGRYRLYWNIWRNETESDQPDDNGGQAAAASQGSS